VILVDGGMNRLVPAPGTYGVIPANFAALGTSPSPLANDADLPGDANTEWMWMLLAPLPSSGTTDVNDQGGYALTGAANGVHTQGYRGFTLSPAGITAVYDTTIETTVGSGGNVGAALTRNDGNDAFVASASSVGAALFVRGQFTRPTGSVPAYPAEGTTLAGLVGLGWPPAPANIRAVTFTVGANQTVACPAPSGFANGATVWAWATNYTAPDSLDPQDAQIEPWLTTVSV
jgi:hypothetical protein